MDRAMAMLGGVVVLWLLYGFFRLLRRPARGQQDEARDSLAGMPAVIGDNDSSDGGGHS